MVIKSNYKHIKEFFSVSFLYGFTKLCVRGVLSIGVFKSHKKGKYYKENGKTTNTRLIALYIQMHKYFSLVWENIKVLIINKFEKQLWMEIGQKFCLIGSNWPKYFKNGFNGFIK